MKEEDYIKKAIKSFDAEAGIHRLRIGRGRKKGCVAWNRGKKKV